MSYFSSSSMVVMRLIFLLLNNILFVKNEVKNRKLKLNTSDNLLDNRECDEQIFLGLQNRMRAKKLMFQRQSIRF